MTDAASYGQSLVKRHMQVGWWLILGFLTLGIGLEWLHATRVPRYINEAFEPRRHIDRPHRQQTLVAFNSLQAA